MLLVMAVTNNNKTRFTYVSLISYKIMRCITRRLSKNSNLSSVHVSGKPLMSQVRIGNLQSVHCFIFLLKQHFFFILYSPGKCWVSRASQRCQSQMPEAEKFTIVQREGGGLRKDLCKRLFLCQIKSVPNPFGQNCIYDSFLLSRRNASTEVPGKIWKLFGSVEEIATLGPTTGVALCSVHSG